MIKNWDKSTDSGEEVQFREVNKLIQGDGGSGVKARESRSDELISQEISQRDELIEAKQVDPNDAGRKNKVDLNSL